MQSYFLMPAIGEAEKCVERDRWEVKNNFFPLSLVITAQ